MTVDGATCLDTLRQITSPKKLCTRTASNRGSCSSVTYTTQGMIFNKICGQAVGDQKGCGDLSDYISVCCVGPISCTHFNYVILINFEHCELNCFCYAVGL